MKLNRSTYTMGLLILITAFGCGKKVSFDIPDRKTIPPTFLLKEVKNHNGKAYQTFSYDSENRASQVMLFGADHFELKYAKDSDSPSAINNYRCTYDKQGRLQKITGPELSQIQINYEPNRVDIIQQIRTIVPGPKPIQIDTLSFFMDAHGKTNRASLLPSRIAYEIRFDQNPTPYLHLRKSLLPLLLLYPLQEVFADVAALLSKQNVLRIYQTSMDAQAGVESPFILDNSYRFDHFRYDIPTSSASFGSLQNQYQYLYSE